MMKKIVNFRTPGTGCGIPPCGYALGNPHIVSVARKNALFQPAREAPLTGIAVPGDISLVSIGHSRHVNLFQHRLTALVTNHDQDAEMIAGQSATASK